MTASIEKIRKEISREMNNQYIADEKEQAIKRGGESYAKGYIEGLVDGVAKLDRFLKSTPPVEVTDNKIMTEAYKQITPYGPQRVVNDRRQWFLKGGQFVRDQLTRK